jgi:hypothetical protein
LSFEATYLKVSSIRLKQDQRSSSEEHDDEDKNEPTPCKLSDESFTELDNGVDHSFSANTKM